MIGEKVNFKNLNLAFYEALGKEGIRKLMYDFYIIYQSEIAIYEKSCLKWLGCIQEAL